MQYTKQNITLACVPPSCDFDAITLVKHKVIPRITDNTCPGAQQDQQTNNHVQRTSHEPG
jgi:hypothetical protein